jgi:hypothetical protein
MSKQCSLYRFTDIEVFQHQKLGIPTLKATHDYRRFTTLGEAQAAVREARTKHSRRNSKVQKLKLADSESEAIGRFTASESERVPLSKVQNLNVSKLA